MLVLKKRFKKEIMGGMVMDAVVKITNKSVLFLLCWN